MWGQIPDVIMHVKFQIDRSMGFGATGAQNRRFPIDFDRRPYNSVMKFSAGPLVQNYLIRVKVSQK